MIGDVVDDESNSSKEVSSLNIAISDMKEEELDKNSTCQDFRQVRKEGNRNVTREIPFYNLNMILSSTGEKLLTGAGKISHDKALEKAKAE